MTKPLGSTGAEDCMVTFFLVNFMRMAASKVAETQKSDRMYYVAVRAKFDGIAGPSLFG
jgi:hypothetical protein